jgi:hypothetical protein
VFEFVVLVKELPFAGYSVVKEPACAAERLRRAIVRCGVPTVLHAPVNGKRERLVENTGLEPVTSWLQTRRSPS